MGEIAAIRAESQALVEWGAAGVPLPGQAVSGDRFLVQPFANGVVIALADGLGHGEEAAAAADLAVSTLRAYASEPVISLVRRCHEALVRTRGVVLALASINDQDHCMNWLGVGNADGFLLQWQATGAPKHESLFQRQGVVGYLLPPLRASMVPVKPRDLLILASDGVRSGFVEALARGDLLGDFWQAPTQEIANCILARFNRGTDDALVLVARYLGGEP